MDILTDLGTPALVHALKTNLYLFFRYLSRAVQTEFHEDGPLTRWHTRLPHPWFNGVLSSQPARGDDDDTIRNVLGYFQSRNVTSLTWWLTPDLPPSAWGPHLRRHSFRYDDSTPGMAVDLHRLNEDVQAPAALRIVPVEDEETLKTWVYVFIIGYELPSAWEQDFFDLMAGIGLELPIRNYLGYLDGMPAATSNLFLAAGVAGIQCVATLPESRGQGLGAALTLAPLIEARQLGYRVGILQSSEMGFGVYRRLGFEKLCAVDHFYWPGQAHDA